MESKTVPGIEIIPMGEHIDFWETVKIAREMSPGDKMILGLEMFDVACDDVRAKIRAHFSDISEDAEEAILGLLVERFRQG